MVYTSINSLKKCIAITAKVRYAILVMSYKLGVMSFLGCHSNQSDALV